MFVRTPLRIAALFLALAVALTAYASDSPSRVTWTSPSTDWNGTMPLGNGEVCVNTYYNAENSRLHLLVARADSWDELGRLAKLAEVCVEGFARWDAETPFEQTLDTETGCVTVRYGAEGAQTRLEIWVDVDRDVVVVEASSDQEFAARGFFYIWRGEDAGTVDKPEVSDMFWGSETPAVIRPDVFATANELGAADRIAVYHYNEPTPYFDEISKTQGLDDFPGRINPLQDRAFGCVLACAGAERVDDNSLLATPSLTARFEIAAHTTPAAETAQVWIDDANALLADAASASLESRRAARDAYWQALASRSWIRFSPNYGAEATDEERAALDAETFTVTQGCVLQRFITACQGRGAHAIKFNGGLFTTAPTSGAPGRHDYRRWGPGYWFQNTRLSYYPMLANGDFELMQPFFDMYFDILPLCEYRVKKYFGDEFEGSYYPECIYYWGDVFPETYGLTPWNEKEDPLQDSGYHKWEWVGGLEIALLALRYYEYTLDEAFLKDKALPFAFSIVKFFDSFYQVDPETGKLAMTPAQACETWWDCDDPAPEVAGLRAVLGKALELPADLLSASDRAYCEALLARIPEVPTTVDAESGQPMLAPAARFERLGNIESPELYPVFPFRLYSFDQPDVELAELAMERRRHKYARGWFQDDLFFSYLGDRANLRANLSYRAKTHDPQMRFPAFWGPNYDWTPDQDHGGVLCAAAQSAVVQTTGRAIFVNPSCPKEWNAEFRTFAPMKTIVEGKIVNGEVVELKVTPEERAKDVVIVK
jgi:alpha-L-fucosidase 2